MERKKRDLLLLFISVYLFSSCGPQLVKTRDRKSQPITLSLEDKELIRHKSKNVTESMDAIDLALEITADKLQFSKHNDIQNGKANCVGYAQYYSAVCNYIAKIKHLELQTMPVVGHVDMWNVNLCEVLRGMAPKEYKNFVKDHDFVQLYIGADVAFIDPCCYDLTGTPLFDYESPFPVM